ncbi:KAP family P-loop NTPase fold protein [Nonomuraea sediminis]|uniref:KAP family P-loop NTPase fold protein n=1 Tax=Nonomuraea sediminis TaxID=2835864 RepID=UPI001BDC09B3|nr:P-loop NTPase fold protein [Nonomuraea sediminis]
MTAVQLAPVIRARRALVFLDGTPAPRRFAHALRVSGFEVRTEEADAPLLSDFLAGAEPGELLVIRWPSGPAWAPSAFTELIVEFGRVLGESSAAALLLVVDFGWVVDGGGLARLNVPGDPPVAAAALTASLSRGPRPGVAPTLTEVLADGLLAGGSALTVGDLYGMAARRYEDLGCDLRAMLFSHGDIAEVPVSTGRRAAPECELPHTAKRLAERGERDVPVSAAELVARVHDLYLSEPARTLLRRAALLPDQERLGADLAEALLPGRAGTALGELEYWGLAGPPHPDVREYGLRQLNPAEAGTVSALLRRRGVEGRPVPPRTRLSSDRWTLDDRLGHRVYAEAIAAFIRHADTLPPLTIGIKGPWGAGKTSLMRMVQALLDPGGGLRLPRRTGSLVTNADLLGRLRGRSAPRDSPEPAADSSWRPTVWFNPWMYQSGEQVWAGLAHEIISQVTGRLPRAERERFWLELNLSRIDREEVRRRLYWLALTRLAPVALGLLVTGLLTGACAAASALIPQLGGTANAVLATGAVASVGAGVVRVTRFLSESADGAFGWLVRQPDPLGRIGAQNDGYQDQAGFLHVVLRDMRRVLDLVARERQPLVVFVDDLDRCSPGTVARVIEAINLFLAGEFPNCVFVLAMEPEAVAAHVGMAYRDLTGWLPDDSAERLGWRFLEKIVQLPLSVPLLDERDRLPGYIQTLLSTPPPPRRPAETAAPPEDLAARLENVIRGFHPTMETLDEAARRAQVAIGAPAQQGRLSEAAMRAADRVFTDLYSDEHARRAIESVLPGITLTNPREVKRYLNVFRFYSFITYRTRPGTSGEAVAKLAALTVGWPHLLSTLTREAHPGATFLDRLEPAALAGDGDAWARALADASLTDEDSLRQLLAIRPPVAALARALL